MLILTLFCWFVLLRTRNCVNHEFNVNDVNKYMIYNFFVLHTFPLYITTATCNKFPFWDDLIYIFLSKMVQRFKMGKQQCITKIPIFIFFSIRTTQFHVNI